MKTSSRVVSFSSEAKAQVQHLFSITMNRFLYGELPMFLQFFSLPLSCLLMLSKLKFGQPVDLNLNKIIF